MRIREIITLLLLILIPTLLLGQNSSNSHTDNTILFKITNPNSTKTSYLFGTHHAFGKPFFDSLTKANQALASCDLLIKENLNIPGEMAEDIINQRTTKTKWSKYLNNKNLSFIKNLFAKSPTDYKKLTPTEMYVFLNRYFKQQVCLNKSDEDASLSLDDYISSKATEKSIELYGLETTKEQIDLINKDVEGMPKRTHKRRLANIINKIRNEDANYCEETNWYSQMTMDYELGTPCRNALMLTERNDKWIKAIDDYLKKENCFIAVGLSHLMYECGLINQLNRLGYTITPMKVK